MSTPHKITAEDVQETLDQWLLAASATTVDKTQRKRFYVKVGERKFKVERRYFEDERGWQVIYWHEDLQGAIDAYNRLS